MAPKRTVKAAMGSVVRTRRTLVQETVEVSVVTKTRPREKKVVEVEVRDVEVVQPPPAEAAAPNAVKGEGEAAAAAEAAPPPTAPKEQQSAAGEERAAVAAPPTAVKGEGVAAWAAPPPAAPKEQQSTAGEEREREEETQPPLESELVGRSVEVKEGGVLKEEEEEKRLPMRRRRRRRRKTRAAAGGGVGATGGRGYKRYVLRVLKQVHPELRVSAMAMTVLDSLMRDMFERLVEEATRLSKYSGKATLSSREIQGAVRLVLPGELGKHAVAEGSKAVANYMAAERKPALN